MRSAPTPISVSLQEREALRHHLLHADLYSWRDWDLPSLAVAMSDSQSLIAALGEEEPPPGETVELDLDLEVLQWAFADIRDGLAEIEGLDPGQALILAGVCERVLGIVGER